MIDKTLVMLTADHGGYKEFHAICSYLQNRTLYPNSIYCASYLSTAVMEIPILLLGKQFII